MKKLLFALGILTCVLGLAQQRAGATGTLFTSKFIPLTIVITPSPIAYTPVSAPGRTMVAASQYARKHAASFARMLNGPDTAMQQLAYDPLNLNDMIAQTTPQGNVKVQFTVKADPTSKNLHTIPMNTTLNAAYGPNTFTCVYQVFASFTGKAWQVTDYVQGSSTTGGGANNGFPTYNAPMASLLQWKAETISTAFTAFANSGAPGQSAFTGAASTSNTVCFDLSLNVPNTIPAGTYQTMIQYNLIVTL